MHLLARDGDPASGLGPAVAFDRLLDDRAQPRINSAGKVSFCSSLTGPGISPINNTAIWAGSLGNLRCLLREGDPAPGTTAGAVFSDFLEGGYYSTPAMNAQGMVAFMEQVTGPGVNAGNDVGIWIHDGSQLWLVAREGDPWELTPGDVRTIDRIVHFGGYCDEDGGVRTLSDDGEMVLPLVFTDGSSGIFLVQIAEPSGAAGAVLVGGLLLARWRERLGREKTKG
jgi:hypothetical protein